MPHVLKYSLFLSGVLLNYLPVSLVFILTLDLFKDEVCLQPVRMATTVGIGLVAAPLIIHKTLDHMRP